MGRKRGAKLRPDVQEPDRRRWRAGRAGMEPQSSRDQGSGGVDPAGVQRRSAFLPGEIPPCGQKVDVATRSGKSAEAVVAAKRRAEREGATHRRIDDKRKASDARCGGAGRGEAG